MLFCSLTFLFIFLPILTLIYYLSNNKYRNIILLIASLLFYAWGEPKYIFLMLISIGVNYLLALIIEKYFDRKILKKVILIISILFNLGLLFYFKYLGFTISVINNIPSVNLKAFSIALPIGISFYTFQILSYVVDVYKGEVKAQKNIVTLGTYIALFPQLIAGPIVRYSTVEEQLQSRKLSFDKLSSGIKRFIVGLGKKVIIANNMAFIADTILNNSNVLSYSWITILVALLAYTFQIYFDFSGYSDMAIGLGKMFGFDFLENFNYPYVSRSITEFWRRWHMSLSTWFRDYIYIPLGGNRCSRPRWIFNIFVVWITTGIWHGANWNFIIWGLYFFLLLMIEKLFMGKILNKLPKIITWIYAFVLINIGWLIFRIEKLDLLINISKNLFTLKRGNIITDIANNYYLINNIPYFIFAIIFSFPIVKFIGSKIKNELLKTTIQNILLLLILLFSIVLLINNSYNPFIYFRF